MKNYTAVHCPPGEEQAAPGRLGRRHLFPGVDAGNRRGGKHNTDYLLCLRQ
jgi:hypothetical protein